MNTTDIQPLVSVIMITYNQEKTINEAIRSVMLQKTDFPFELVIGNDCSTDSTAEICSQWTARYPDHIVFINRPKNIGPQHNFLDTYRQCRGKYIAICEGDDFWCSRHKLHRQVAYLEAHPECTVSFHRVVNYRDVTGEKKLSNGFWLKGKNLTASQLASANIITAVSVMYRALPYDALPQWLEQTAVLDLPLHLLHAAEGGTIHFSPRIMAVYRRHQSGIWSGNKLQALELSVQVRRILLTHFADRPDIATPIATTLAVVERNLNAAKEENSITPQNNDALKTFLSAIHQHISRLIPLPRIHGKLK